MPNPGELAGALNSCEQSGDPQICHCFMPKKERTICASETASSTATLMPPASAPSMIKTSMTSWSSAPSPSCPIKKSSFWSTLTSTWSTCPCLSPVTSSAWTNPTWNYSSQKVSAKSRFHSLVALSCPNEWSSLTSPTNPRLISNTTNGPPTRILSWHQPRQNRCCHRLPQRGESQLPHLEWRSLIPGPPKTILQMDMDFQTLHLLPDLSHRRSRSLQVHHLNVVHPKTMPYARHLQVVLPTWTGWHHPNCHCPKVSSAHHCLSLCPLPWKPKLSSYIDYSLKFDSHLFSTFNQQILPGTIVV